MAARCLEEENHRIMMTCRFGVWRLQSFRIIGNKHTHTLTHSHTHTHTHTHIYRVYT